MKISVLIGSRKRAHILKRCVECVLSQDHGNIEVLILNDGLEDVSEYEGLVESFRDPEFNFITRRRHSVLVAEEIC